MLNLIELFHGQPTKKVIIVNITGLEGKLTVCKLIHHVLKFNNIESAIYSNKKTNFSKFVHKQLKNNIKIIICSNLTNRSNLITENIDISINPNKIAKKIKVSPTKLSFVYDSQNFKINKPFYYLINGITTAYNACKKLNINSKNIIKAFENIPSLPGQQELVSNNLKINTYVDSSQTPLTIKALLSSFKLLPHNQIIVIFGHSSFKNKSLRPEIGKIINKFADIIYLTADDIKNETVKEIASQIFEKKLKKCIIIENRQDAFNQAIKKAQSNDIIIALGHHHPYLIQNNTRFPWSDQEAFRTAFRNKYL